MHNALLLYFVILLHETVSKTKHGPIQMKKYIAFVCVKVVVEYKILLG